jgi:hypothetical protein
MLFEIEIRVRLRNDLERFKRADDTGLQTVLGQVGG